VSSNSGLIYERSLECSGAGDRVCLPMLTQPIPPAPWGL